MGQFYDGRAIVVNGGTAVDICQEISAQLATQMQPGDPMRFTPSGARMDVVEHNAATARVVMYYASGTSTDPSLPGDTCVAPDRNALFDSGSATSGAATTLTDTGLHGRSTS